MATIKLKQQNVSEPVRAAYVGKPKKKYDWQWAKLRRTILYSQPVCNVCGKNLSEEVDHITPYLSGATEEQRTALFWDMNNLQGICKQCHIEKHREGKRRGKKI